MALFNSYPLIDFFNRLHDAIKRKIGEYNCLQLKSFSDQEFNAFVDYYRINKIEIDLDKSILEPRNGTGEVYNYDSQVFEDEPEYIDVQGKYIRYSVPVLGEWQLLKYDPASNVYLFDGTHDENYKEIELKNGNNPNECFILFEIFIPDFELKDKTKEEVAKIVSDKRDEYIYSTLRKIRQINNAILNFNNELPKYIQNIIDTKIKDDSSLAFLSEAIGVEIQNRNGSQEKGSKVQILPQRVDVMLPQRKKYNGFNLDTNNYSAIISTIRNHLTATEDNPSVIKFLNDEEMIRDTILWALNTNYIVAKGETFRNEGKTDISVSFNDKSVFVAECKVWKGEAYLREGIDQLLSYSTWRDSKMAIIVFNLKNKDFSAVCCSAKAVVKKHPAFSRTLKDNKQNFFECEFKDLNNEESTITLSLICANYVTRNE